MSRHGILVRIEKLTALASGLRRGDQVEVDVELPARPDSIPRLLHCRGAAMWWKADGNEILLGLAVDHMHFRPMAGICHRAAAESAWVM